jgi:acetyl-CoA carboxylase alpha subunit
MESMAATDKAQQELEQIERQVAEMESSDPDAATRRQIAVLQERIDTLRRELNAPPTAWQKTELARHPQRPQSLDYIERIFTDFSEIHGDRAFGDDAAIVTGMARFHGDEVLLVATQKGRDMKQRVFRNFGTPHPEGYRKAIRAMQIAEKFRRPIFWSTPMARIRVFMRKSAAKPKRLLTTCVRWRGSKSPSSRPSSAWGGVAAHWPSPWPTAS